MTPEERQEKAYEWAEEVLTWAKGELVIAAKEETHLIHTAFPISTEAKVVTAIDLSGEPDKRREQVMNIHRNLAYNQRDCLIIMNDAWGTPIDDPEMSPQEALRLGRAGVIKRKEAIVVLVCGKDIIPKSIFQMYSRSEDGKTITFGEREETHSFESWMVPKEWTIPVPKGAA